MHPLILLLFIAYQLNAQYLPCANDCNLLQGGSFEVSNVTYHFSNWWISPFSHNSPDLYQLTENGTYRLNEAGKPWLPAYPSLIGCAEQAEPQNPHTYKPNNYRYLAMARTALHHEGVTLACREPLQKDQTYVLSFYARRHREECPATLEFLLSFAPPCIPPKQTNLEEGKWNPCPFEPYLLGTEELRREWFYHEIVFTAPAEVKYLIIHPGLTYSYPLIDDVRICPGK